MKLLGKLPACHDDRTLFLPRYTAALPLPPGECDYFSKVTLWGQMLNDELGDCVAAAAGHMELQWSTYANAPFRPTDKQVQSFYENSGYDPMDPTTDQGWDCLSALKTWRGTGLAGKKVAAFLSIMGKHQLNGLKNAVHLFGNCYVGLMLPLTAQEQTEWTIDDSDPDASAVGSWGGHCVPIVGYDPEGLTVITWGAPLRMSWNFFARYCDEAFAVLSADWIEKNGKSPCGLDLAQLQIDLGEVTA